MNDIIDRLNDEENFIDAIDDAITEIENLRLELCRAQGRVNALNLFGDAYKCGNPRCKGYYVSGYICKVCGGDNSVNSWEIKE